MSSGNINSYRSVSANIDRHRGSIQSSFERLSSGIRVRGAQDDSAALSTAGTLNIDALLYGRTMRNVNDGISLANIRNAALTELQQNLERQLEITTAAQSTILTTSKRDALQQELNALTADFNRITDTTKYNEINLFSRDASAVQIRADIRGNAEQIALRTSIDGADVGALNFEVSVSFDETFENARVADIDNDGNLDVIGLTGSSLHIYRGDGAGNFSKINTIATLADSTTFIKIGDVNGDGNLDIVELSKRAGFSTGEETVAAGPSAARVLFGQGTGGFETPVTVAPNFIATTIGDVNGNGRSDLIGDEFIPGDDYNAFSVYSGQTNNSFIYDSGDPLIGIRPHWTATTADTNNSGPDEVYVVQLHPDAYLSVYNGSGSEIFKINPELAAITSLNFVNSANRGAETPIISGDFNNDGNIDIGITGVGRMLVALGNGDNTFSAAVAVNNNSAVGNSAVGDFNGDGNKDILLKSGILIGRGDGTFDFSSMALGFENFAVGDINNDGIDDIITGNTSRVSRITSFDNATISYLDVSSVSSAQSSAGIVSRIRDIIEVELGHNSAATSRLSKALEHAEVSRENLAAATLKITSIDVAEELTDLVSSKVRQNTATALLAHAEKLLRADISTLFAL